MKYAKLRVKIKSLAAEASIIRHEENKVRTPRGIRREAKRVLRLGFEVSPGHVSQGEKPEFRPLTNVERVHFERRAQPPSPNQLDMFFELRDHRTNDLRQEARSAQLALAFLQGKLYRHVEPTDKKRMTKGAVPVPANPVDCARVAYNATKFAGKALDRGAVIDRSAIEEWIDSPEIAA